MEDSQDNTEQWSQLSVLEDNGESKDELINSVKSRTILYNPGSNSNRNRYLRENAWSAVATDVSQSVLWCKAEWKKLKDLYAKKKKAIIGKTGQARKKIESWEYFHSLQFLDDFSIQSQTIGNVESPETVDVTVHDEDNTEEFQVTVLDQTPTNVVTPKDVTHSKLRAKKRPGEELDTEIAQYLKRSAPSVQDSHHHFAMALADDLRKLTAPTASYLKLRISQLVYETSYPEQGTNGTDE